MGGLHEEESATGYRSGASKTPRPYGVPVGGSYPLDSGRKCNNCPCKHSAKKVVVSMNHRTTRTFMPLVAATNKNPRLTLHTLQKAGKRIQQNVFLVDAFLEKMSTAADVPMAAVM